MSDVAPAMRAAAAILTADTPVTCPHCDGLLTFRRSHPPFIDACGFESYRLECPQCGAAFTGIIDPADDALILSECD